MKRSPWAIGQTEAADVCRALCDAVSLVAMSPCFDSLAHALSGSGALEDHASHLGLVPPASAADIIQLLVSRTSPGQDDEYWTLIQSHSRPLPTRHHVATFSHQLHRQATLAQAVDAASGQLVQRCRRIQEARSQVRPTIEQRVEIEATCCCCSLTEKWPNADN